MIRAEDLTYVYPPALPDGPRTTALDRLSFEVPAGACLAVTGPNGCGKTTLCLAVAGLAPRLTGGHLSGRVTVAGRDVQAEPPGALADLIGIVFQDPVGQLFNPTVEDEIAWGLENLGLPPSEIGERIEWALGAVGLTDVPREQPPQTLSGGQQKRLALAAALALRPQVLILDEPSGGLAPAARAEMIAVLRDLRARHGLTLLLTENDPAVIVALADEVLLLDGGRPIRQARPRDIYPALNPRAFPGVAIPPASRFAAVASAGGGLHLNCLTPEEAIEQARHYPLDGVRALREDSPAHFTGGEPAVQLEGLTFAYRPGAPVLRDLDLTIRRGEFVVLTGDNGAGKTTLAKHLIGLLRPTRGTVRLFGAETARRPIGELAHLVGFAFQNPELQIFSPTVREEVAFGPRNLGVSGPQLDRVVEHALRRFNLLDLADHPPAALSFSARRMVALASIAAMETPILVLDEPTVGLDAAGQARVMNWLEGRHREGATVLLITHDMELAAAHAGRMLVLERGEIVADGPPRQIFSQPDVLKRAGLGLPFAARFAQALGHPALAADLTPEGVARVWLEALQ
ncbi:MAG TPA: energy-coupling factor ABC transporter ATP-binding protein [Chloroflexi bacterium]|nr:energy-coupling factor ABC transporter ATP-binding protein [Chloroflexota bacterium]